MAENLRTRARADEPPDPKFKLSYSEPPIFSEILVASKPIIRTFTRKIECGEKGIAVAVLAVLACSLRFGGIRASSL